MSIKVWNLTWNANNGHAKPLKLDDMIYLFVQSWFVFIINALVYKSMTNWRHVQAKYKKTHNFHYRYGFIWLIVLLTVCLWAWRTARMNSYPVLYMGVWLDGIIYGRMTGRLHVNYKLFYSDRGSRENPLCVMMMCFIEVPCTCLLCVVGGLSVVVITFKPESMGASQ